MKGKNLPFIGPERLTFPGQKYGGFWQKAQILAHKSTDGKNMPETKIDVCTKVYI